MVGFHAPAPQDMQMRLGKLANTLIGAFETVLWFAGKCIRMTLMQWSTRLWMLDCGTDLEAPSQPGADSADDGDQLTKRTRMQTEGAQS